MREDNAQQIWENIWSSDGMEIGFWHWIDRDSNSVRTKKIEDYIKRHFGKIEGLNVIEVGSGMGAYSFIFAKKGARITLLDRNQKALDRAKIIFEKEKIKTNFLLKDIFNLNKELNDKFDIAMSFGTVEHFKHPERFDVIKAHYDLLKNGGILIIGVPNLLFFPHEIMKFILRRRKKWFLGYEGSFSRRELGKIAVDLNLKNWKIIGSSFIHDFKKYLQLYKNSSIGKRFFGQKRNEFLNTEKKSIFDDFLGADIVLLGIK